MSQRSKDRMLDSFAAITGCSRDEARGYLQAVDWNEQAAVSVFFDNAPAQHSPPKPSTRVRPTATKTQARDTRPAHEPNPYDSDEDLLQEALAESLRLNQAARSGSPPSVRSRVQPAHPTSKLSTVDDFRRHAKAPAHEGETYYAGGSDRSGQQIIAPPKPRGDQKGAEGVFDAARRLGATEVRDQEPRSSSTQAKQEKPFTGAGRPLNSENAPRPRVANDEIQLIPIRFYSNGFTVGDGDLRRFEENREFIESVKRGEVPPELRPANTNGRQVQVRLEDHSKEEYKRVVPEFQSFSGAGHAVGLPGASKAAQATGPMAVPESLDVNRLQELAAKRLRTSSTSSTTIRLRLPDISTPLSIPIDLNRTLADVRKFLNEHVPSLQTNTFEFMQPPSTRISREEERRKIRDAQLANSTLIVRRTA